MDKIIRKIDDYTVELVNPEKVVPEEIIRTETLEEAEAKLKQAEDSLVYIKQRHEEEIKPIQATINLFRSDLDKIKALGIITKPIELPVEETPVEEIIGEPVEELLK